MEITVQLPDDIVKQLGDIESMSRQLLESFAIEGYRSERLTRHQVSQLLGLDYWQTDAFLVRHKVKHPYTVDDLAIDQASLDKLDETRGSK